MDDVLTAKDVQTAADIPLNQDQPIQVGSCIVTTVYLESERPRGRIRHRPVKVVEAGTGDGAVVDSAELQELADLGLPTTFASAQKGQVGGSSAEDQTQRHTGTWRTAGSTTAIPAAGPSLHSEQWLQAYDAVSQRHYFIPPDGRQPQWEPPAGARPDCLPAPFAWSQGMSELQQAAANTAEDAADSSQAGASEEPALRAAEVSGSQQLAPAGEVPADGTAEASGANGHADAPAAPVDAPDAGGAAPTADEWVRGPMPRKLWKYWMQRYTLFARFDDGVLLDEEGWFSVTPEAIARHQAERCACGTVLDPFAGVGGNVIQLAATCDRVIAGELSSERASLIRHNAEVYGVADRVEVHCRDFWDGSATAEADVVFLSPPWGGPQYLSQPVFSIEPRLGSMSHSLADLLHRAEVGHLRKHSGAASRAPSPSDHAASSQQQIAADTTRRGVVVFLPKNTSLGQLSDLVLPGHTVEVERNILDGFFKGITVYFWDGLLR